MARLIYLVHRIPYPPNKGDKIRSFNLLKQLAKHHDVYLGAFVDEESDWQYTDQLREWCAGSFFRPLPPARRRIVSLKGLITGDPLTVPYYQDRKMAAWVTDMCVHHGIEHAVVFSSAMAQYVMGPQMDRVHRVVDLVDVDSEKWRQYAPRHKWPMSWVYRREAARLLSFERQVAAQCDATVLVSAQEADLFKTLAPESAGRIYGIPNGVDAEYFSPAWSLDDPYRGCAKVLVFTGAMDYWANVDAVTWFAEDIFPRIRAQVPDAQFYIVGARPTENVKRLSGHAGVKVTGAVHDIRPYLTYAAAAVAPLRIARGIQNKVLEAMAMAKPVLATQAALDGIDVPADFAELICNDAEQFALRAVQLLEAGAGQDLGPLGRNVVLERYDWSECFGEFENLVGYESMVATDADAISNQLGATL